MSAIPSSEALRLLNLAYRKMQLDFRVLRPDMFRDNESITTDSDGYLNLPNYVYEVEFIYTSDNLKLSRIDLESKLHGSGYYEEGVQTSGANDGKRRLMVRENGAAKTSTTYTVQYLREYDDLSATSDTPYPFVGKAWLDMLSTLQAYFYFAEQGKERSKEKAAKLEEYDKMLGESAGEHLDDEPEYLYSTHGDAGDKRTSPTLTPSTS